MIGRDRSNVWVYEWYMTNALSYYIYDNYSRGPWKAYFVYTSYFLVSPQYYSTSSGSMRLSFSGNLNDYYHEYHGIGNSFQDHNRDHVIFHIHGFEKISHSHQGIVRIQLDGTGDFSSKAHYFA